MFGNVPRALCALVLTLAAAPAACSSDTPPGGADPNVNDGSAPVHEPGGPDASAPDAVADATPDADAALPAQPGLRATYYRNHGAVALERIDPTVDFTWEDAAPDPAVGNDHFSVRWEGTLDVPAAGTYTFAVTADDGARLWIGDKLVTDDWTFHATTRSAGTVTLPVGPVSLRLEYFDKDYGAAAHLAWKSDAFAETIIPVERLRAAAPSDRAAPKPPYDNPVLARNCPDPGILADPSPSGPTYWMVCTGGSFAIRRSSDLVIWEETGKSIFPTGKPPWALNGGRNWAPELHRIGTTYIAYYTSVDGSDRLAIGAATATTPQGPWTDVGAPLVQDPLGAIDATYFRDDDGRHYLVYKIDGNSQGKLTPIYIRELATDGRSFAAGSSAKQILVNDPGTWEGGVVEAPWLVKRGGMYFIFYSGNVYDSRYRTGVARASSVLGPYEKRGQPILGNNARWVGPGHGSVVSIGTKHWFVYHAWSATPTGGHDSSAGRQVLLDAIKWSGGWPTISDGSPSRGLEEWPSGL